MKLTVLVDNNTLTDRYFLAEPGLSFHITADDKRILFDTGYSDVVIRNATKKNIDLKHLDFIALSHGHNDHTGGLDSIFKLYQETIEEHHSHSIPTIISHTLALEPKRDAKLGNIGSSLSKESLSTMFNIVQSSQPLELTENLIFLSEIPRVHEFEKFHPKQKLMNADGEVEDFLADDSALVYKTQMGLVIITGCAHAGICNIVDYAMNICNDNRILDIIGGFHLLHAGDERLHKTIDHLKKINPMQIHACHCTGFKAKFELHKHFNLHEVGVGMEIIHKY